jgi:hypothetical protein
MQIRESGKKSYKTRPFYEDAHIFCTNLHAMGLMTNRDFQIIPSFVWINGIYGRKPLI